MLELKTHVLRYWETEFAQLQPVKSRANQRLYRREDVETALLIKDLLYRQGFTIAGARQQLKKDMQGQMALLKTPTASDLVRELKRDLQRIRKSLIENKL